MINKKYRINDKVNEKTIFELIQNNEVKMNPVLGIIPFMTIDNKIFEN